MNNIEKIKSGTYKDYLANALFGGFALGLIFFLINLIKNDFSTALIRGFGTSFSIVIVLFIFGFIHEEWFKRGQKIKLLTTEKFSGLKSIGLTLNNDLDFVGYHDNYFVRFITSEKWTKKKTEIYNSVDIYCNPTDLDQLRKLIERIKNLPDITNAAWGYGIFSIFFQKDTEQYEILLKTVTKLLKDHNVKPIEMKTWENSFGTELRTTLIEKENQQTKQLLKIGKLDIKYKKK